MSVSVDNGSLLVNGDDTDTKYSHKFQALESIPEEGEEVYEDDDGIDHHNVDLVLDGTDGNSSNLRINAVYPLNLNVNDTEDQLQISFVGESSMSILDGGSNNAILESSGVNGGYSSIPIQGTGSVSVSVDNGSLLVNSQESNPQIEFASNVAGAELNLSSNSGDTSSLPIQGTGSVAVSVDNGSLTVNGVDTTYTHHFEAVPSTVEGEEGEESHYSAKLVLNDSNGTKDVLNINTTEGSGLYVEVIDENTIELDMSVNAAEIYSTSNTTDGGVIIGLNTGSSVSLKGDGSVSVEQTGDDIMVSGDNTEYSHYFEAYADEYGSTSTNKAKLMIPNTGDDDDEELCINTADGLQVTVDDDTNITLSVTNPVPDINTGTEGYILSNNGSGLEWVAQEAHESTSYSAGNGLATLEDGTTFVIDTSGASNGYILSFNGNNLEWIAQETHESNAYTASGGLTTSGDYGTEFVIDTSGASDGYILSYNGSDIEWVAQQSTSYTASGGLTTSGDYGTEFVIDTSGAQNGHVLSYNGSDLVWVAQQSTSYTASGGLTTSGDYGTEFVIDTSGAQNGHVLSYNGSDLVWIAQQSTSYTASGGLTTSGDYGTEFVIDTSGASDGYILSYNGSDIEWVAQQSTSYTASGGLTTSGDYGTEFVIDTSGASDGYILSYNGSDIEWVAQQSTSYTASGGLTTSGDYGTEFVIDTSGAQNGHVLSYNGSDLVWVAQQSTSYSADNGLSLDSTSNTFSVSIKTTSEFIDAKTNPIQVDSSTKELTFFTAGRTYTATDDTSHDGHHNGEKSLFLGSNPTSITGTAGNNSVFGIGSLGSLTEGYWNTIIGADTGSALNTGSRNVVVGVESLKTGVTTSGNVAIGNSVLSSLHDSSDAEYKDENSNIAIGNYSLSSLETGSSNIAIGSGSGINNTTGSNNIMIGHYTGPSDDAESTELSNSIVIGNFIVGNGENTATIGGNSLTTVYLGDDSGGYGSYADLFVGDINAEDITATGDINAEDVIASGDITATGNIHANKISDINDISLYEDTTSVTLTASQILYGFTVFTGETMSNIYLPTASVFFADDRLTNASVGSTFTYKILIDSDVTLHSSTGIRLISYYNDDSGNATVAAFTQITLKAGWNEIIIGVTDKDNQTLDVFPVGYKTAITTSITDYIDTSAPNVDSNGRIDNWN